MITEYIYVMRFWWWDRYVFCQGVLGEEWVWSVGWGIGEGGRREGGGLVKRVRK